MTETFQSLFDISQQIGVRPSALSNWQKRYPDFPAPRVTKGQRRLYLIDDIKEFMDRHQLFPREERETVQTRDPMAQLVLSSLDILRGTPILELEGLRLVAALAYLSSRHPAVFDVVINTKHAGETSHDVLPLVQQCLKAIDKSRDLLPPRLLEMWNGVDTLNASQLGVALRNVLQRMSDNKFSGQFYTPPTIARLIYKLAPGLEILDVCSGSGEILNQYRRGARRIVGLEINESTAFFNNIVAQLNDDPIEIICENTLKVCHPEWMENGFDAVVCDAPMGLRLADGDVSADDLRWAYGAQARRNTSEDYWIQTVLAYLRPSFSEPPLRGIVTLRAGWFSESAESQMRAALVKAGVVEAVVSMGGGCLASTSVPFGLLILRKSGIANRPVRFVDATEAGNLVRGRRSLATSDIDLIVSAVNGDAVAGADSKIKVVDVPVSEIIANSAVLQSSRYLEIADALPSAEEVQFNLELRNRVHSSLVSDYMALVNSTVAEIAVKTLRSDSNVGAQEILVGDLIHSASPIEILFKNRMKGNEWTRDDIVSSDVVVNLAGSTVGQAVRGSEFHENRLTWNRLWVLRTRSQDIDFSYLFAWARFGDLQQQIRPMVSGTTIPTLSKSDIVRVRIPIPPLDVQRQIAHLAHGLVLREEQFLKLQKSEQEVRQMMEISLLLTTQTSMEHNKKGDE
jgi:type I restriction-modification system DNA methylase subunit